MNGSGASQTEAGVRGAWWNFYIFTKYGNRIVKQECRLRESPAKQILNMQSSLYSMKNRQDAVQPAWIFVRLVDCIGKYRFNTQGDFSPYVKWETLDRSRWDKKNIPLGGGGVRYVSETQLRYWWFSFFMFSPSNRKPVLAHAPLKYRHRVGSGRPITTQEDRSRLREGGEVREEWISRFSVAVSSSSIVP